MFTKLLVFLWKDFEQARSYRLAFLFQFGSVGLTLIGLYFMNRLFQSVELESISRYGGNYVTFLIVGMVVTVYSDTAIRAFSRSLRDAQVMGTLEVLLLTRAKMLTILFGWAIYPLLRSTTFSLLYVVGGFVILGISLRSANVLGALLTAGLTVIIMMSLGILAASFTLVAKRGDPFTRVTAILAGMISGVIFPVSLLPGWLQAIAQLLPHTHAIEAMRLAILQGSSMEELVPQISILAIYAAALIPTAIFSFGYAMNRVRIEGSLAHY